MLVEAGELGANLTGGHREKAFQTAKRIIKCRVQSVECKMAGDYELRFGPFYSVFLW